MIVEQGPFLIVATVVAMASMWINLRFTKTKLSADRAFWWAWLFLIWSAEFVTTVPYFDEYSQYTISYDTRNLTLITFFAAAAGFLIGSVIYSRSHHTSCNLNFEENLVHFAERWQGIVPLTIFLYGLFEFYVNWSKFNNLLEIRLAAVSGDVGVPTLSTQFFYFAQAFVLFVGFSDGHKGQVSRFAVVLSVGGLILHNLATGGRINVVVAPMLYLIAFVISANQRSHWLQRSRQTFRKLIITSSIFVISIFSIIRIFRSTYVDMGSLLDPTEILFTTLFAIPMYVSDTFISISIHAEHAYQSNIPFGYFTFDAFYRLFQPILALSLPDQNLIFGHAYYRDTSAVWAWTQTNMIPRLIADFGSLFWIAVIIIGAIAQWISLYRIRLSFVGVAVQSIAIFSSLYSILNVFWFSAFNVYVIFYSLLIYFTVRLRFAR